MAENLKQILKLDDDDLNEVSGGAFRLFARLPFCMVCGKRMSHGPSTFVYICTNDRCSQFSVVKSSKFVDWR
ncbi:MAG: hypothetical protein IJJ22_00360 [Oscillospiraceae bacterium]|nr:hypothetical protein [Oscillospiraceae bacterium]